MLCGVPLAVCSVPPPCVVLVPPVGCLRVSHVSRVLLRRAGGAWGVLGSLGTSEDFAFRGKEKPELWQQDFNSKLKRVPWSRVMQRAKPRSEPGRVAAGGTVGLRPSAVLQGPVRLINAPCN